MKESVTAAFQQQLAQRRANIYNMFKNPQDALGDDVIKAEETEELDNNPEETEDEDTIVQMRNLAELIDISPNSTIVE